MPRGINTRKLVVCFLISLIFVFPASIFAKVRMNPYGVFVDSKINKKYRKSNQSKVIVVLKNPENALYVKGLKRTIALSSRLDGIIEEKNKTLDYLDEQLQSAEKDKKLIGSLKNIKKRLEKKIGGLSEKIKSIEDGITAFADNDGEDKVKRVLASLKRGNNMDEFEIDIKRKFSKVPAFSGTLTKKGYRKLKKNGEVFLIAPDKKLTATLDLSVPLMNADDVNAMRIDSDYIDGTGETVAIIDSGIDYTHPALGGCTPQALINITSQEAYSLESAHNYLPNTNITWTITKSGYSNIAVYFQTIDVENGFDFVYVMDASNNVIQTLTGNYNNNFWSRSVPGDTVKVRLVSDNNVQKYGFKITQVANGVTNTTPLADCNKVVGGYDFVSDDYNPLDDQSHGTHVAGIVASSDATYKGVAPGAKLIALKVLDSAGNGNSSDVAAAVEWCINNKNTYGITAINMSLGDNGQYNSSTLCDAYLISQMVNLAAANGIFVAVASGNNGYTAGVSLPACASGATAIGAVYTKNWGSRSWATGSTTSCTDSTTTADKITCFTNRGSLLDLLAPGSLIKSSLIGTTFGYQSGTSMASPHAAGAAALIQQNQKAFNGSALTVNALETRFKSTGVPIVDSATGLTFKRIDTFAALDWTSGCSSYNEILDSVISLSGNPSWDAITKTLSGTVDVTNLDSSVLYESRIVLYDISEQGVSVLSPDGYMDATINGTFYSNLPYYYYGTLTSGGSSSVFFRFYNPSSTGFSFKATLFATDCS